MPIPKELKCAIFDNHMNVKGIQPLLEELKEIHSLEYDINDCW